MLYCPKNEGDVIHIQIIFIPIHIILFIEMLGFFKSINWLNCNLQCFKDNTEVPNSSDFTDRVPMAYSIGSKHVVHDRDCSPEKNTLRLNGCYKKLILLDLSFRYMAKMQHIPVQRRI